MYVSPCVRPENVNENAHILNAQGIDSKIFLKKVPNIFQNSILSILAYVRSQIQILL